MFWDECWVGRYFYAFRNVLDQVSSLFKSFFNL